MIAAMPTRPNFADPTVWETIPDVPLLDEHLLRDDEAGGVQVTVDERMLADIANNNNARYASTGDACPLIVGHTTDDPADPEKPVVGYALDFKVRPFAGGKKALYATFKVKRKNLSIIDEFPRRSVELWVRRREIDPVSLLGGTTPERNLGVVTLKYSRADRDFRYRYSLETPMAKAKPRRYADEDISDDIPPKGPPGGEPGEGGGEKTDPMVAKLMSSASFMSWLHQQFMTFVDEAEGGDQGEPGMEGQGMPGEDDLFDAPGGPGGPMAGTPGGMPPGMPPGQPGDREMRAAHEGPPVRFDAGAGSYGSGTNGCPPGYDYDQEPSRMNRQRQYPVYADDDYFADDPRRYGRQPAQQYPQQRQPQPQAQPPRQQESPEMVRLRRENGEMKVKMARNEARAIVADLKGEGYEFDEIGTVKILTDLAVTAGDAARDSFVNDVVKKNFARRQKDPTEGSPVLRYGRQANPNAPQMQSPEDRDAAVRYARENGISDVAQAWAALNGHQPKPQANGQAR